MQNSFTYRNRTISVEPYGNRSFHITVQGNDGTEYLDITPCCASSLDAGKFACEWVDLQEGNTEVSDGPR